MAAIKLRKFRQARKSQSPPWDASEAGKGKGTVEARKKARADEAAAVKAAAAARIAGGPRINPGHVIKLKTKGGQLEDQFRAAQDHNPRGSDWWDFYKHGINNSGIGLWLTCKHQFWLRYVCGYEQATYNESIEFGNVFHWLCERWHKKELKKPLKELLSIYDKKWLEDNGGLSTPKVKESQQTHYALAASLWPIYAEQRKLKAGQKVEGVEVQFDAPHKLENKRIIPLYGTMDLAYRDAAGLHLVDHKTTSFINHNEIQEALGLNFQLLFYAYAWQLSHKGEVPASVTHDVIRRTTSKPHKGESLEKYARRMRKEAEADPKHFFVTFRVPLTPAKLTAYAETVINPILDDMADWADGRGRHYPNPNALVGRYGPCRLFAPITSGNFAGVPRMGITTRGVERGGVDR